MRLPVLLLGMLALPACNSQGFLWPAGMEQQPSLQPLTEARPAPEGAVPLGGVETVADRDDVEDARPPAPFDPAAEAHGKVLFSRLCTPCHGPEAKGDGPVSRGFPPAPNLRHVSICRRSDGYLYGTLIAGGKAMPSMREGTSAPDRWSLVAFVRALQREGCTGTSGPGQGGQPP